MKWLAGVLFLAVVGIALISCGGQGTAPGVPILNDYRTGSKPIVKPESLCIRNPDNPDGWICSGRPTRTPIPSPPPYGSQGSCAVGYVYFSDGCEDDGTNLALYPGWASWASYTYASLAVLKFNDSHFWPEHLVCYLTGSTNPQVDQAITDNFNIYHYEQTGDPPVGTTGILTFTYTDPTVGAKTIQYHIFHYGQYSLPPLGTVDLYNVGTAYIPGFPNCPS
ncbi:MAG TPA: hypothetical protein VMG98_00100 [Verrucomicrobiae bacterium]|nr:hypothetical protein [Verrucomicrobiae bacterium]